MNVLGIDTSTVTGGVALLSDDRLVGESVLNIRTTHSERLLPALERLLADAGITVKELDLLSVVTGPGSFTGLRIGVGTAKGLSYALGVPIVGVTTLEGYGWQFKFFPGIVVAMVDARRENVFWQAFREGIALVDPSYGSLQSVLDWCSCSKRSEEQFLFVGDGAINYGEQIRASQSVPPSQNLLRPSAVAHLGYTRYLQGEHSDAFSLNPTYMRQTEAERKWQEQM
ncbi:MAG TPA: tRNA (adenosine(37)-N6)-threonylcarbamoyltransferase complex dimerization subunit type 1 TsaB [Limnochordia bacterium]|mgnify:CR=1 FL=1|nr:tRNA (adenosine(37)-N6)-threonylcarbamoyltransferase complex dimerization subunit type 1 TsaB [Limnochordia bacterium]